MPSIQGLLSPGHVAASAAGPPDSAKPRFGWARSWLALYPTVCVGAFLYLYSLAAWIYSGGTRHHPRRFSFLHNYWCDLVDARTPGGAYGPSRSVALAAMAVVCSGLVVFCWMVPALFPQARRRGRLARWAGPGALALFLLVATPIHDFAVNAAGLLGAVAFCAVVSGVGRRAGAVSVGLARATAVLGVANFCVYLTGFGLAALPLLQKAAFAALLGWVVATSSAVTRLHERPGST